MSKDNNKKAPKVRFPGFDDDWEERKLSEVVNSVDTGKSKFDKEGSSGEYPILGSTSVIGYDDEYDYEGDFILTARVGANAGSLYRYAGKVKISDNTVFIQTSQNIEFLYQLLVRFDIKKLSFGTGQPLVKASELKSLELMMPTDIREQMRIGTYFSNLDHLITLHQRKLEKLKEYKKGMLKKMFPKSGEKVPEVRFPGFTDDWEQRKFAELVTIERGGSPRPIDKFITQDENGLNWVKIGDAPEHGNYITQTAEKIKPEGLSKTREVHPGDLILSNSMSFGRPYIMAIDGCIHDGWLTIRDTEKRFDLKFLCTLLGTDSMLNQYKAMAAGSTVNNLNKELVGGTTVLYPNMEEQIKLGSYFSNLDHLITLHQRKLEMIKEFKKGCLQQMFV